MSDSVTSAAGTNALHVCIAISGLDRANTGARGQDRRRQSLSQHRQSQRIERANRELVPSLEMRREDVTDFGC